MTARAVTSVPSARRIRNGVLSRPAVRTRSMPSRAIADDPGVVADRRGQRGQFRQGREVVGDEFGPGGQVVRVGCGPAVGFQEAAGGRGDVVAPRAEHPHVSPLG